MKSIKLLVVVGFLYFAACAQQQDNHAKKTDKMYEINKSDKEWKAELTSEEYRVLREKGTEKAFSNAYNDHKAEGTYLCAACNNPLFSSETKFDSGTGWPSFYAPIDKSHVGEVLDKSHGMLRTEVVCNRCGSHIGHVFNDGPEPTGLRYCLNSVALDFKNK